MDNLNFTPLVNSQKENEKAITKEAVIEFVLINESLISKQTLLSALALFIIKQEMSEQQTSQ